MKLKNVLTFTACGSAMIACSTSSAAPFLTVMSHNFTDPFLVANGLESAVIGVGGFALGENLQGFIGVASTPWTIATTGPNGFFNVDSNYPYFDGQGQTAANNAIAPPNGQWDTGVIMNPTTNALGMITSGGATNAIGFAQFGVGQTSGPGNDVYWLSLNPDGLPITGTVPLFRVTWSTGEFPHLQMLLITNTGNGLGGEHFVQIPPPPAPGVLGLFAVAGLAGKRRRRDVV